jgi:hypothetical protein
MSYPGIPYAPDYTQYHWTRPYVYQPQYPRPPPITYAPCEPYDPRLHVYERFDTVAQADEFRKAAKARSCYLRRSTTAESDFAQASCWWYCWCYSSWCYSSFEQGEKMLCGYRIVSRRCVWFSCAQKATGLTNRLMLWCEALHDEMLLALWCHIEECCIYAGQR